VTFGALFLVFEGLEDRLDFFMFFRRYPGCLQGYGGDIPPGWGGQGEDKSTPGTAMGEDTRRGRDHKTITHAC